MIAAVKRWIVFRLLLFKMKLKSDFGYYHQVHTFISLFVMIVGYLGQYMAVWIIMNKFQYINGWSTYEVLFLYSLNLLSYAAGGVFSQVFWRLDQALLSGGLDEVLIKPIDPFVYYLTRGIAVQYSAHISLSLFFIFFSLGKLGIVLSPYNVVWLVGICIGGSLIQGSITISLASTAFWTRQAGGLVQFAIQSLREFIQFPISIYPWIVQFLFTFLIPYGFVNFYPAYRFFHKTDVAAFSIRLPFATLIIGVFMAVGSYAVWRRGLRRYESIGA